MRNHLHHMMYWAIVFLYVFGMCLSQYFFEGPWVLKAFWLLCLRVQLAKWWLNRREVFLLRRFHRRRPEWWVMYLFRSSLDMNLLSEGTGGAVDARIMHTAEHQHLVIGFVAKAASFTYLVAHYCCYNNKILMLALLSCWLFTYLKQHFRVLRLFWLIYLSVCRIMPYWNWEDASDELKIIDLLDFIGIKQVLHFWWVCLWLGSRMKPFLKPPTANHQRSEQFAQSLSF